SLGQRLLPFFNLLLHGGLHLIRLSLNRFATRLEGTLHRLSRLRRGLLRVVHGLVRLGFRRSRWSHWTFGLLLSARHQSRCEHEKEEIAFRFNGPSLPQIPHANKPQNLHFAKSHAFHQKSCYSLPPLRAVIP